jgi:SAM-dependent methyltransferase
VLASSSDDLVLEVVRSAPELAEARARAGDRVAFEGHLCEQLAGQEVWTLNAFCQACRRAVTLHGDWLYSDGVTVNFRERLVCPGCQLNNRQRFMAELLSSAASVRQARGTTYLYEQVTPFYAWVATSLEGTLIGSEYLGPELPSGSTANGVRHEDALALSFRDGSLEAIVSNDVFEHVPDIDRALAECVRVLRPGGRLYFSIPFHETPGTTQRAAVRNGHVVELLAPEYHGNPVDPKGSLVFYNHGWDILDRCRGAGFTDAYVLCYWSLLYGYLGAGLQLVFVAERS